MKEIRRIIQDENYAKKYGDESKLIDALFMKGRYYHQERKFDEAISAFRTFISSAPKDDHRLWEAHR